MIKYILKRLLLLIPVLIGVVIIIFTILYFAPGDPAVMALGDQASPEALEDWRVEMGINGNYFERLTKYIWNVFHGNLGKSYVSRKPITTELMERIPATLIMATAGIIIATILGIFLGVISASKQYSVWDTLATVAALFGVSMPMFWQGLMLILLFSVALKLLPPSGFDTIKQMILPISALGIQISASIMRSTRSSMLEVLRSDFVRTARAKGLKESKVITHHALQNAMIPVATIIGVQFGKMLAGSVIIESIFSIPGIGKYMIDSINSRNFAAVQGAVLVVAFTGCIINLLTDIAYAFIDPRLKTMFDTKKKRKIRLFDKADKKGEAIT